MLMPFNQFLLKQAVRSPVYILSPPAIPHEEVTLPRYSVVHNLDTHSNNHFIQRDLYYLRETPATKKVPVFNIPDLRYKEETTTLENKHYMGEIRKWVQSHIRTFRSRDLLETPNDDVNLVSVYNYNLLKDLYKYKSSLLARYYRFSNLYKTYYEYVKAALDADQISYHFVAIDLPNALPNFNIINMMLKFNLTKFSRVVTDMDLLKVVDLYRWLADDTRQDSTLTAITDEDARRVLVEFRYKGYSCFIPLSMLRSMSTESALEGKIKYKPQILHKIFIVMLRRFQDKVNGILDAVVSEESPIPDPASTAPVKEIDTDDGSDSEPETTTALQKLQDIELKGFVGTSKELKKLDLDQLSGDLPSEVLDDLIDAAIVKFEVDNKDTDVLYEASILQVDKPETPPDETPLAVDYTPETVEQLLKAPSPDDRFEKFIADAVQFKTLTPTEVRSLKKLKETRRTLKSPYAKDTPLDQYVLNTTNKTLDTPGLRLEFDNPLVEDDLKTDIIGNFDKQYLKTTLKKDVVACVASLEKSGIVIKDYSVEEKKTATDRYEIHKLTLRPLGGKESTVYFRLPLIDSEGEFMGSSIRCKMRKMRTDLPIRKISATRVALTSNYSKLFVFRTDRKAFDPQQYLVDYLRKSYLSEANGVQKIIPGVKSLNEYALPNTYHTLASQFNEVRTDQVTLLLNYKERHQYLAESVAKDIEAKGLLFCGYLPNKHILVMDQDSQVYDYSDQLTPLGTVEDLLGIAAERIPKAFTMVKILGDNIPLGVVLAYYLGLSGLLAATQTRYELLEPTKHYKPTKRQLVLRLQDKKLILDLDTPDKELLFNGFLYYKDYLRQLLLADLDHKNVYLNLLETRDAGLIHLKEMNLLEDLFLDPITIDVLQGMNEPTEFFKLLLRANALLKDFQHPDTNDPQYARIRGYDRVPGLMYRALAESVRDYKIRGRANGKIELDPYKVWNYITQDSTVKITEDVNPIVDLKEMEAVTLSGLDGLSKDATPKNLRRYHKKDIGLISEATVDSSDVALNTYLTPYAKLKDIRGTVDITNVSHESNPSKVFSTSVLLAPMSDRDDNKRIVSI